MKPSYGINYPMVVTPRSHTAHVKVFQNTPLPGGTELRSVDDGVLPYMARVTSPIRVTYTPNMDSMKRKSRVADITRSATFRFRPVKRGDRPLSYGHLRVPEATLPTLQYLSPWLSITKTDFIDPRRREQEETEMDDLVLPIANGHQYEQDRFNTPSVQEASIVSPSRSEIASPAKSNGISASVLSSRLNSRMSSVARTSSEKRVTILEPSDKAMADSRCDDKLQKTGNTPVPSPSSPPRIVSREMKLDLPDKPVNYYSGYLPPELSDRIAEKLKVRQYANDRENGRMFELQSDKLYKPLVGDRSLYMREPYPTRPKLYQSDIDQLRFEGHDRLLQSKNQAPSHFSVLNNKFTLVRSKQAEARGARFDIPVIHRTKMNKTAIQPRNPQKTTSMDQFQLQRERTYHLQNQAREMLNK